MIHFIYFFFLFDLEWDRRELIFTKILLASQQGVLVRCALILNACRWHKYFLLLLFLFFPFFLFLSIFSFFSVFSFSLVFFYHMFVIVSGRNLNVPSNLLLVDKFFCYRFWNQGFNSISSISSILFFHNSGTNPQFTIRSIFSEDIFLSLSLYLFLTVGWLLSWNSYFMSGKSTYDCYACDWN